MIKYLSSEDAYIFSTIAGRGVMQKGCAGNDWRDPPELDESGRWQYTSGRRDRRQTVEISPQDAAEIFDSKIGSLNSERMMFIVGSVMFAVEAKRDVAICQFREKSNTAFDPEGWLVVFLDHNPFSYINPEDLPTDELEAAGLVSAIIEGSDEAKLLRWEPTIGADGRPNEVGFLLDWPMDDFLPRPG